MLHFFTGTPGSGKSLHMAMLIDRQLRAGRNVIANFEINERMYDRFRKRHPGKLGHFIYVPNHELLHNAYLRTLKKGRAGASGSSGFSYIDGLYGFARSFHRRDAAGRMAEAQTLLVLDECQELFNPRSWNRSDRLSWCSFFREHRKYGYDVYLISQDDKVVDKQIRAIIQFEYVHRSLDNYKFLGRVMSFFMGGKCFVWVKRIYGERRQKDAKVKSHFFAGQQKYYDFYDSYKTFGQESATAPAVPDNWPDGVHKG